MSVCINMCSKCKRLPDAQYIRPGQADHYIQYEPSLLLPAILTGLATCIC